jgi:hypothetical protein
MLFISQITFIDFILTRFLADVYGIKYFFLLFSQFKHNSFSSSNSLFRILSGLQIDFI